jgi:hypothetical protein
MNLRLRLCSVCFIVAVLCGLLVPVFASAGELFRYRLPTKDGRKFEYVFESSAQPSPRSVTREEAARIAANWMTTFYHLQPGSLSTQNSTKSHFRIGSFALQIPLAGQSNACFSPWCCRTERLFNRAFRRGCNPFVIAQLLGLRREHRKSYSHLSMRRSRCRN